MKSKKLNYEIKLHILTLTLISLGGKPHIRVHEVRHWHDWKCNESGPVRWSISQFSSHEFFISGVYVGNMLDLPSKSKYGVRLIWCEKWSCIEWCKNYMATHTKKEQQQEFSTQVQVHGDVERWVFWAKWNAWEDEKMTVTRRYSLAYFARKSGIRIHSKMLQYCGTARWWKMMMWNQFGGLAGLGRWCWVAITTYTSQNAPSRILPHRQFPRTPCLGLRVFACIMCGELNLHNRGGEFNVAIETPSLKNFLRAKAPQNHPARHNKQFLRTYSRLTQELMVCFRRYFTAFMVKPAGTPSNVSYPLYIPILTQRTQAPPRPECRALLHWKAQTHCLTFPRGLLPCVPFEMDEKAHLLQQELSMYFGAKSSTRHQEK